MQLLVDHHEPFWGSFASLQSEQMLAVDFSNRVFKRIHLV